MDLPKIRITPANETEALSLCQRRYGLSRMPPNWQFFFARDGKKVAGCITVEIDANGKGKIMDLGIKPEYERIGIGGRLVGRAKKHLASKSISDVEVVAAWESDAFYKKQGFSKHQTAPGGKTYIASLKRINKRRR